MDIEQIVSTITEKTNLHMDYHQLDDLISTYFKVDYEIVAYEELSNDSVFEINVAASNISSYDLNTISHIKNGKIDHWSTSIYMSYLAKEKVIPEGNYIIEICW